MALSDILQRFRRIWAPPGGPSGAAGIPSDQRLELTEELTGLFAALDEVEKESAAILAAAQREADQIRAEAESQAARLRKSALARAPRERLLVAQEQRQVAEKLSASRMEEALQEAERIRRRAAEREPRLVAEVVRCITSGAVPETEGDGKVAAVVDRR